jgi:predicted nucleic acid-binding protein
VARYVIDAPTLLHMLRTGVEVHDSHRLVGPNLIRSQASTLLLRAVTEGDLSENEAVALLEQIAEIKIRVLNDRVSRRTAWRIAREQGWETTDDAEYVAVCRLQADALVTVDTAFAARIDGLVPVAPLEALTAPA